MTPQELKNYLDQLVSNTIHISVMIWGPPGVGKSSVVQQVARDHNLGFVDLRLSQLAPTDLRGLPVPHEGITYWAPPEFLPQEGKGILFLDEINMAPPALQGVAQQLILDRQIGNYQVPEGWYIWSAGNRKEDRASVFDMPAPLANRFVHLDVEVSLENFRLYAFKNHFSERLIAFLAFRQDLLHKFNNQEMAWPSPRSWEMANILDKAGLDIAPAVGLGAAAEYYAYLDSTEKIPDIAGILAGQSKATFPEEVSLRYATVMSLIAGIKNVNMAVNGMKWLVDSAMPEWVQLFVTDTFPLMREKKLMDELNKEIIKDDALREFLADYAQMMSASALH